MKLSQIIKGSTGLLRAKFLRQKICLAVGLAVTNRCNLRCSYCNIFALEEEELTLEQLCKIIQQLAEAGCVRLNLTGGEPLLRADIKKIIEECKQGNISTTLTTNAVLLGEKIALLKDLDLLVISLDGIGAVNDQLRGTGTFEKIQAGIKAAKEQGLSIMLATVIAKTNKDQLAELLDFGRREALNMHFQFISDIPITKNSIEDTALSAEDKREVVDLLLKAKQNNEYIVNSVGALKALLQAPKSCAAGRIFFRVSASGKLYNCWRDANQEGIDLQRYSVNEALQMVKVPDCKRCHVADGVELTRIYDLNPQAIIGILKKF